MAPIPVAQTKPSSPVTPPSEKPPQVNPINKILALALAAVSIVSLGLALFGENEIYFLVALIAGALAGGAYQFHRGQTAAPDEWHYRQSKTSFEDKELTLDDHFRLVINPPVFSDEDPIADVVHYIFHQNALYQVHPYEAERFEGAKPQVGDRLKVKIIVEDGQQKILECAVAARSAVQHEEVAANRITAKFFGHYPKLSKRHKARDTFQRVRDRILVYDGRVLKDMNGRNSNTCYVVVNGELGEVSMEDFLQHKVGDMFTLPQRDIPNYLR